VLVSERWTHAGLISQTVNSHNSCRQHWTSLTYSSRWNHCGTLTLISYQYILLFGCLQLHTWTTMLFNSLTLKCLDM